MYYSQQARLAIYAEGQFGRSSSKTAEGVIRYGKNPIAAIIDSTTSGRTVKEVTGIPDSTPIVASLKESLSRQPDALLLGTAWVGGHLPAEWRSDIMQALENGLDVINGLHDFLSDDAEIARAADKHNRRLLDVRRPPAKLSVASGKAIHVPAFSVLTVGSDCSVGKMTASLELTRAMEKRGFRAKFMATGQTGIMIEGHGIAIDRVIGDFMSGAAEQLVLEAGFDNDFVFVEGQGSLVHPGFSGVTLSLLHGSAPESMILCHRAGQTHVKDCPEFPLPGLAELVRLYESTAAYVRPAKVAGVVLNTRALDQDAARTAITRAEAETGLPANDPVRFGCDNLIDAILNLREKRS